jgi:hypothetical protein
LFKSLELLLHREIAALAADQKALVLDRDRALRGTS